MAFLGGQPGRVIWSGAPISLSQLPSATCRLCHLQHPRGAEPVALHCSAWSASANGGNVGQWPPSQGPWMLTPPGTGAFCPSTNCSSPRELSGHHSNCGFLALGVGAQGPASLPNTWVSWGSMKVEPGPRCADGGRAMLGDMSSPGRTGKKDKLSGTPPPHPVLTDEAQVPGVLFKPAVLNWGPFCPTPRGHCNVWRHFWL